MTSRPLRWLALGAVTVAAAWALDALGLPSATLFAALLVGLAVALRLPGRFEPAPLVVHGAQGVTGVVLGAYLQSSSLEALAHDWLPVALVSAATLLLSLLAGHVMARVTDVDEPTAALGMVAGGASGIVAMANELGADDRVVAFMQYVRVLLIVLTTPLIVALFFGDHHAAVDAIPGGADGEPFLGDAGGWLLTPAVALAGVALGRLVRLPVATLMGPLLLASVLALTLPEGTLAVPPLLRETAFALIGLQVGLRFTADMVKWLGRLLVPVLATVVVLAAACFGLAAALAATTHVTLLDAYLATTPGGLYAVLVAAVGSGADTTFVVAVQTLRLLVMIVLAPFAVRLLLHRRVPRRAGMD
ncbi:AbrB family transcriptional regulator [Conexibacter stalactiti]|uniref:AbrB family transcriptional regulator n=1 Tax=Conexibacter stalactiti TaxID=1940611 RepID=A0ABU4HT12_9ACTN|nr:AbrB family transcriptional regulator [Conexibacter stalactiti]MDW5596385.1 AbrB family transcriptional regulator [Conexibacter stalactiti]MEC5037027.1 AbrB family transcriptional regulator [Conexibacter stalactiti]